jgi:DNA-binding response OmpR family regulator
MSVAAIDSLSYPAANGLGAREQFGSIVIDRALREVRLRGLPVTLTPKEFSLLSYFASHAGRLLTRHQLVHEVWGERYTGGPRTVDIHISRLRRKLGTDLPLDTLRRVGYRFGGGRHQQLSAEAKK